MQILRQLTYTVCMKINSLKLHSFDSTRQVMKKETFEIFHYMGQKISNVPIHHHDFYEIYYFIKGPARYQFRIESKVYQMQPGSLLLTSPMELHQPLPAEDEDYERIVVWINRDYLHRLSTEDTFLGKCYEDTKTFRSHLILPSPRKQSGIYNILRRLITESENSEFGSSLYAESILKELMVELSRFTAKDRIPPQEANESAEMISSALDFINSHYSEQLTLDALSQKLFVSKYYLAHEFKASVGISLYRFITLKRLMNAGDLLSGGMQPSEVSKTCGFNSYSSFYRAFTDEYGISPKNYSEMLS